jgi:hypothetical protein
LFEKVAPYGATFFVLELLARHRHHLARPEDIKPYLRCRKMKTVPYIKIAGHKSYSIECVRLGMPHSGAEPNPMTIYVCYQSVHELVKPEMKLFQLAQIWLENRCKITYCYLKSKH